MSEITHYDVEWCKQRFALLSDGGVWAVPRSGLVFQKFAEPPVFVLVAVMPHEEGMPLDEVELREFQHDDFNIIKYAFKQAGIEVNDDDELLS